MVADISTRFVSLHQLARSCGLPMAWLEAEAKARRLPCLRVGRRLMFNPDLVKQSLIERSTTEQREAVAHA